MRGTHLGKKSKAADAKELRVMVGKAGVPVGAVDHGGLAGLTDDDHTQYVHIGSSRTITAQHTIAPTTVKPPFVLGINAHDQTVIGLTADKVNRTITAGAGLLGGGSLMFDLSLSLNTPGTLTASTTNSATGNHTHEITSSANPGANQRILRSDTSGHLRLTGMGINATPVNGNLALSTGGEVGVMNSARMIFDSPNNRVEVRRSLRLSADGSNPVDLIYNTGGLLTIQATGDIELGPDGDDVLPTTNYEKNLGLLNRKWLTIHAAELWVQTLVAQEVVATIGGRIVVAPTTVLEANLVAASPSVIVKHNQIRRQDILYMEGGGKVEFIRVDSLAITAVDTANNRFVVFGNHVSAFVDGHTLFVVESPGGIYDGSWTIVNAVYNGGLNRTEITVAENLIGLGAGGYILYTAPAANTAPFTYLNVARNLDGSGANDWFAGDAIVNMGVAGDGFIDIYSTNGVTAGSTFGPTIVGNVRNSTTYNDWSESWAIGNLNGLYGYSADTYGVGLGKYDNGNAHMVIDPTFGIQMRSRNDGVNNTTGWWFPSGDIILGPIQTNKANLFWDVSEGRLNIRGGNLGIEVGLYIDQDGTLYGGGGEFKLSKTHGLEFAHGGSWGSRDRIRWVDAFGEATAAWGEIHVEDFASQNTMRLTVSERTNYHSRQYLFTLAPSNRSGDFLTFVQGGGNTVSFRLFADSSVRYIEANGPLRIPDGITAPTAVSGWAYIYVDSADGDLKVRFGNNVTKTIVTDT